MSILRPKTPAERREDAQDYFDANRRAREGREAREQRVREAQARESPSVIAAREAEERRRLNNTEEAGRRAAEAVRAETRTREAAMKPWMDLLKEVERRSTDLSPVVLALQAADIDAATDAMLRKEAAAKLVAPLKDTIRKKFPPTWSWRAEQV